MIRQHARELQQTCVGATEQYNLDRMDAEEDAEDDVDETEINSNMLINLPRDQQRLITADFFRQAMLAATAVNTGASSGGSVPSATAVTEVGHLAYLLGLQFD